MRTRSLLSLRPLCSLQTIVSLRLIAIGAAVVLLDRLASPETAVLARVSGLVLRVFETCCNGKAVAERLLLGLLLLLLLLPVRRCGLVGAAPWLLNAWRRLGLSAGEVLGWPLVQREVGRVTMARGAGGELLLLLLLLVDSLGHAGRYLLRKRLLTLGGRVPLRRGLVVHCGRFAVSRTTHWAFRQRTYQRGRAKDDQTSCRPRSATCSTCPRVKASQKSRAKSFTLHALGKLAEEEAAAGRGTRSSSTKNNPVRGSALARLD
jgi:hypothetical protein